MAENITDTRNGARPNSARATGTRSVGGTSLACDNLAGWPVSPRKVHFVTYQIDSASVPVVGTQLDCTGIVSGNTIGSFTVIDGSDVGNSVNDVVEMLPTAAWGQDLADGFTNQHTRAGVHSGITTDTIVVSSGTTLPAGDIVTADIADASITNAKLSTSAGEIGAAWASYVPTLTGITLGNGSILAYTKQVGKTVNFRCQITFGTTTTLPTGVDNKISVPIPINTTAHTQYYANLGSGIFKISTAGYLLTPIYFDTNTLVLQGFGGTPAATILAVTTGNYGTPGTGSIIQFQGTYEAA